MYFDSSTTGTSTIVEKVQQLEELFVALDFG
jgi:hypothetical protein